MSLSDSCQEGVTQFFSGSIFVGLSRRWKSSSTQSMMRMMRCGGRPSVRTVAMSDGLMVWRRDGGKMEEDVEEEVMRSLHFVFENT